MMPIKVFECAMNQAMRKHWFALHAMDWFPCMSCKASWFISQSCEILSSKRPQKHRFGGS
jgi:hypothetical protein